MAWRNRVSRVAPTWMKPEGCVARGKLVSRVCCSNVDEARGMCGLGKTS